MVDKVRLEVIRLWAIRVATKIGTDITTDEINEIFRAAPVTCQIYGHGIGFAHCENCNVAAPDRKAEGSVSDTMAADSRGKP